MNEHPFMQEEPELSNAIKQSVSKPAAFKPVYEAYFSRVYHYCLRRVENTEDAEDLTSQIFTRALSKIASYRGGSFPAWLFRIAHSIVVNYFRDKRATFSIEDVEQIGMVADSQEHLSLEERQRVDYLLATLSVEQRNLLALRMAGGLSAREIGMVLGKREGTIRTEIHRIIQQLRRTSAEEEEQ
ncbi:MAG: sigma-70 family RNA polymerase sigma factor [Anaerolineaceae bacterium]